MGTKVYTASDLATRYDTIRRASEALCAPLETEDYVVQSMEDCSPTRWHLAHVSWFFEAMVLKPHLRGYVPIDDRYHYLFNSYYNTLGRQWSRPQRGLITRPTVAEVYEFRAHVDAAMGELFERSAEGDAELPELIIEIGLQHEQQHQELIVTDFKHLLSHNPLHPVYRTRAAPAEVPLPAMGWTSITEGIYEIGAGYGGGFVFDIETPRHNTYLHDCEIGTRLITSGEYKAFMADGGYERPELWLSKGWATVQEQDWRAPLYWDQQDGAWFQYSLSGFRPVVDSEPVCHVSMYEADAYATWAGARLPREAEWEVVAALRASDGNLVERELFHPTPLESSNSNGEPEQMFGDVWEWTSDAFCAYPGYARPDGALGEYNAKFTSGQYVLRGGSCVTPASHIRATYRNFFCPPDRWQFSGIRLARG